MILLRSDLHGLFDVRKFALVPKTGVWVSTLPRDGRAKSSRRRIGRFARFAWIVLAQGLLIRRGLIPRRLVVWEGTSNIVKDMTAEVVRCSICHSYLPSPVCDGAETPSNPIY